jgi:ferrous iron transport protein A
MGCVPEEMQVSCMFQILQPSEAKAGYNVLAREMQVSVKKHEAHPANLSELKKGETAIIERLDLPEEEARRLMEMGFLPGHAVTPAHSAPGGGPTVFRVDGSEVALRKDTARHLILRENSIKHKSHKMK